ncbi:hypothetical protein [Acinetobacter sp. B51(2017)]|uniref:hypothetical protein n=1 Tax=Acinetobacter sp. B51(2017) TaxID=2060938 RepID=UPI0013E02C7D|nr:hypothetical protein [Acinetobacter sp. B51(2017)]
MNRQYLKEIFSYQKKLPTLIFCGLLMFMGYSLGIQAPVLNFQQNIDSRNFVFFAVALFAVCTLLLSHLHEQSLFQFILKLALRIINNTLNLIVAFCTSLAIACLTIGQFEYAGAVTFTGLIFYALVFISCTISIDLKNKYSIIV